MRPSAALGSGVASSQLRPAFDGRLGIAEDWPTATVSVAVIRRLTLLRTISRASDSSISAWRRVAASRARVPAGVTAGAAVSTYGV